MVMKQENRWQEFFDGHAPVYHDNVFTKNTSAEVDFILNELNVPVGSWILDIGCGRGRHAIELAKRGYRATGIDLSAGMLELAKKEADDHGLDVEWIQMNAAEFTATRQYDAAICLCEGALCLLGQDDDPNRRDLTILKNIAMALKPGATFILTVLNGCEKIRRFSQEDIEKGVFDPIQMVENFVMDYETSTGETKQVHVRERGYILTEIKLLCELAGFEVLHLGGGTAGNWGKRVLDLDEIEIMVIARHQ